MSVTVSLFDPLGLFVTSPHSVYEPRRGAPIALRGTSTDAGMRLVVGKDSVTLAGTAGGQEGRGPAGLESLEPRGLRLSLDAGKALTLATRQGWSALECARRLAEKVNARNDFRATVEPGTGGAATLHFARR
ncbi:MAG: hypothetical protein RL653_583 [Pseudomonadota bacterium]|jgi:hypothetical protein